MNKILDMIQHQVVHGERLPMSHPVQAEFSQKMVSDPNTGFLEAFETSLTVKFKHRLAMDNPEKMELIRKRGAISVARYVYSDVTDVLLDIRETAWQEGLDSNSPVLVKLNKLIEQMGGAFR